MANALQTVQPSWYGSIFNITAAKGDVVLAAAAKAGHTVTRVYGFNASPASDHRYQQCIDFMHYGNTAMRDWLVRYLVKNAGALGVMGIISNKQRVGFPENERNAADREVFWSGPSGQWRRYGGDDPHTDHVHVQFNTNRIGGGLVAPADSGGANVARPSSGGWKGELFALKAVPAFNGNGNRIKDSDLKKGESVKGEVDADPFGDGRYFRVGQEPHRVWYPLDDKGFSHEKGGAPLDAEPTVSLKAVVAAAKADPDRKQGGTTSGSADDVRVVEAALKAEGLLDREYAADGSFGSSSIKAYAGWQKSKGYKGKDADGIPGKESLRKLGARYDFKVVA